MGNWQKIKLGEFLHLYRNEHIVQDDKNYRQVTISKNHGISFRGSKVGKTIGRKRQFIIDLKAYPNTLLFTRQGIREGAIGIAPAEVDGCIVTENMPMMSIDTDLIEVEYLRKLLLSEYLFDKIRLLSVTGSAQKSIHERDLLKIEIELPSIEKQRDECRRFNSLDIEHSELKIELTHQQTLLKKLRQQILQEAIEGKLTADWRKQNPDIEPASKLLKRIQAEKAQLIKDKKIKQQKPLPPISEEEKPFDLPAGWVWCRFQDVAEIESNLVDPYDYYDHPHIAPNNIEKNTGKLLSYNTAREDEIISGKHLFYSGQLLYSKVRPNLNKVAFAPCEGLCSADMYPIRSYIEPHFLHRVMLSEHFLSEVNRFDNRVKMPKINQNQQHAQGLMQTVLKEAFTANTAQDSDEVDQEASNV